MRIRVFLVVFILSLQGLYSQVGVRYGEKKKYSSYGVHLNVFNYVGELDPGPSFLAPSIRYTRPSFGLTYVRRFKPSVSWRGTFTYGSIKGDDYVSANEKGRNFPRKQRNLNFKNTIWELKGDLIFDFIGHNERYEKRHEYVPYGFVGLAFFKHDPKGQIPDGFAGAGSWIKLRELKTEGVTYSPYQVAIPFGLGFRYKLAKNWDLAFEVGWRFTFTDYLDDVSRGYGDPAQMSETARMMAFKSSFVVGKVNPNTSIENVVDANGNQLYLPGGVPLKTLESYGGEYVYTDNTLTQKQWKSDILRGDKNKDWYVVTGVHLTYIPPLKTVCPKFRY